jgi:hypothetical protein
MFIIRLTKYGSHSTNAPSHVEHYSVREAKTLHVRHDTDGCTVLQLGDAPGETHEFTIGERTDCAYSAAFVMNEHGRTIDKVT